MLAAKMASIPGEQTVVALIERQGQMPAQILVGEDLPIHANEKTFNGFAPAPEDKLQSVSFRWLIGVREADGFHRAKRRNLFDGSKEQNHWLALTHGFGPP